MYKNKKLHVLIILLVSFFSYMHSEISSDLIQQFKQIDYCTITFISELSDYSIEMRVRKNTIIKKIDFPKLSDPKYKLHGWKYKNCLITNDITVTNDMLIEAVWKEKPIQIADWIQIIVVIVAFFGIIFPICVQRNKEKEDQEKIEAEKPKLRLHSDEKDEGIFTKCRQENGDIFFSFKIRVFNDGFTTAKNVQVKILTFDISDYNMIADFDKTIKLNWSYQDQQKRLHLPLEKKMDIQAQTFEDCDFVFFNITKGLGYFASEQSNIVLTNKGLFRVSIIVSGDNILSDEYFTSFYFDPDNLNNPISVKIDFQKMNKNTKEG